jgi:hypothetical protein
MAENIPSESLIEFVRRYPVILQRYRRQYRLRRGIGFILLALWMAFLLPFLFKPGAAPVSLSGIGQFLAAQILFFLLVVIFMGAAEEKERQAESVEEVKSICDVFRSEAQYILILRSFDSKLVSEKVERVTEVEREATRLVRGELIPTGKKYTVHDRDAVRDDNVVSFVIAAALDLHVFTINKNPEKLSAKPVSIISTPEQWWSAFEVLAKGACLIVIVPELSASLLEEIRSVMALHREKAIILMPSSVEDNTLRSDVWLTGFTRRQRWEEIRPQIPLDLPEYTETGAIIILADADQLPITHAYDQGVFEGIVRSHQQQGTPAATALATLHDTHLLTLTIGELERRANQLR